MCVEGKGREGKGGEGKGGEGGAYAGVSEKELCCSVLQCVAVAVYLKRNPITPHCNCNTLQHNATQCTGVCMGRLG